MSDTDRHKTSLDAELTPEQRVEMWHALFDASPDPVLVHGPDGELSYYSSGALSALGYTDEEMRALKPFGWVDPDSIRGAAGRLEAILHDGGLDFDSGLLRKDGTVLPTRVRARRVETPLGPAILSVIHDMRELEAARSRLVHLAYHDSLTGLPNRPAFEDRLRIAIAGVHRHHDVLALAYLDLDKFKPINDAHGHETGDQVLIEVGRRIQSLIREQDLVARLGGDEFVVVLPRLQSREELGPLAERLHDAICAPMTVCGADCVVDASIGFAIFDPEEDDARSVVVKADLAMYAAKSDPEHRWRIWSPDL
ncbi:MAG: sensor domain-containing diguanylate cyclase [Coriobacteriia bacterium]|nr:sensor domain-containing diguanylate cyclase [Coriobacteriia bacterium]